MVGGKGEGRGGFSCCEGNVAYLYVLFRGKMTFGSRVVLGFIHLICIWKANVPRRDDGAVICHGASHGYLWCFGAIG